MVVLNLIICTFDFYKKVWEDIDDQEFKAFSNNMR